MTYERYAIYWVPPEVSALGQFARRWMRLSSDSGERKVPQETFGLNADLARKATEKPGRYGFHATIKAPFRPVAGVGESELRQEMEAFCAKRRRVQTAPLGLERFTSYLALCPTGQRSDLEWLASDCVTHFDRFRAPLSDKDRARRNTDMPEPERLYFEQFGYPYIFSRFYFHISLAGPLEERELDLVASALRPELAALCRDDFVLTDLCLVGDPGGGAPFRTVGRFPLIR